MTDFLSLGISETSVRVMQDNGIIIPTPIQEKAIPFIMEGNDIIAQAQTGTGKTLAFILPILEKMNPLMTDLVALIVTPTRELALQITAEIEKFIIHMGDIYVLAVFGGQDIEKQLTKLQKKVQIVVGTPGRLLDHVRRGSLTFSHVNYLVLDEADQLLDIGFLGEVKEIIRETPVKKQSVLFSATIPSEIRMLGNHFMRKPKYIQIEQKQGPATNVKQMAIFTTDRAKQATLIELIRIHHPYLAVIFCRTKRRVNKLYEALYAGGFKCGELHGNLSQAKREEVLQRFRNAEIKLLIATDVAARGMDVEGVTHVFNYDIPREPESYVHRIGRTGRAGTKGFAITLYSSKDRPFLDIIEKQLKITIPKKNQINTNRKTKNRGNSDEENVPKIKGKRRNGKGQPKRAKENGKNGQFLSRKNQKKMSKKNSRKKFKGWVSVHPKKSRRNQT